MSRELLRRSNRFIFAGREGSAILGIAGADLL